MINDPYIILSLIDRPSLSPPLAHSSTVPIECLSGTDGITHTRPIRAGGSREPVSTTTVIVLGCILSEKRIVARAIHHDYTGRGVSCVIRTSCRICWIIDLTSRCVTNVVIGCGEGMINVVDSVASISDSAGFKRLHIPR